MQLQKEYSNIIKFSIIICLSIICLEVLSYVSMIADSEKCQYTSNPMFADLDMEQKQKLCVDISSIKYNHDLIRLHEPEQHLNTLNINSHGFRGEEFDLKKQENEYRIVVVGSSMILGLGATSDNTTIPYILEQQMENYGLEDVTVINAGIIAANSAGEIYMIDNILPKYEPDMIIVYEGYNDSWNIPIYDLDNSTNQATIQRTSLENFVKNNFDYLNFPKMIYQKTHDYLAILTIDNNMMKENAELWKNRWDSTCETYDIPILLLMQPIAGIGNKKLTDDEKYLLEDEKYKVITQTYSEILNVSKKSLLLKHPKKSDLTNIFDSYDERIYLTRAHLTDNGNYIIAEKMFELSHTMIR